MRIVSNKYFFLFAFLLGMLYDMAAVPNEPPSPTASGSLDSDVPPPPPPGLFIDGGVDLLLMVAILLGVYVVYKNKLKID